MTKIYESNLENQEIWDSVSEFFMMYGNRVLEWFMLVMWFTNVFKQLMLSHFEPEVNLKQAGPITVWLVHCIFNVKDIMEE